MSVILQFSQTSSPQIPFTMNKSLNRQNRQFGRDLKNHLSENDLQEKLALKTRSRKSFETHLQDTSSSRPQMEYFDEVLKYALTSLTYPNLLRGPQKVKKDIEMLLSQVTGSNGFGGIWNQKFMKQVKPKGSFFCNEDITLEKRTSLIDWIISVHKKYKLRQQTLHIATRLIDDYCTQNYISLSKYQLLGATALFMAAKYEEIQLPRFKDYHRLIESHFQQQDILNMEGQILCKSQFLVSKKITTLWYLEAFGMNQLIFGKPVKYSKKCRMQEQQSKENLKQMLPRLQQEEEDKYQKFMTTCRYFLNLIVLDYELTTKFREDIIAISTLIFVCLKRQYADADSKGLLKYFSEKKQMLIQQNQSSGQISRTIRKCMKKIQKLNSERFDNRFYTINEKFNIDIRH